MGEPKLRTGDSVHRLGTNIMPILLTDERRDTTQGRRASDALTRTDAGRKALLHLQLGHIGLAIALVALVLAIAGR